MDRLLIHPYPETGEALAGYLLRLAGANGYRRPSEILLLAGISYQGEKTLRSIQITSSVIKSLSAVTCRPEAELESLTYRPEVAVTKSSYVMWGNCRMPLISLRRSKVCVCPICLTEKLYVRQAWDWDVLPLCLEHKCVLQDSCHVCGRKITRHRAKIALCSCGADFRDSSSTFVSKDVAADFVAMLARVKDGSAAGCAFVRACAIFAGLSADTNSLCGDSTVFDTITISDQYGALVRVLEASRRQTMPQLVTASSEARLSRVGLAGPRAAVLPFMEYRPLLLPLGEYEVSDVLTQINIEFKACSSTAEPAQPSDVRSTLIKATDVAFVLGVSPRLVASFVTVGALQPSRGPTVDAFGTWKFQWDDVVELIAKACALAEQGEGDVYSFKAANLPARVPGIQGTVKLVEALRAGRLRVLSYEPSVGLPSLRYQVIEAPGRVSNGTLSVKDMAGRLKIYPDAVYRLIHRKFLPSKKVGKSYFVTCEDFAAFSSTYVFVRELASSVGANPTNFAEKLIACGAAPVSGPRVDGTLVYLFQRAAVSALDLTAVAALDEYSTTTGRKATFARGRTLLLSSSAAAARLEISVQQLSSLVRNRFISEAKRPNRPASARHFLERELARYQATFSQNIELITLDDACAILNISRRYIHFRWLGPKFVHTISDGLVDYLSRTDLARMQTERAALLTTAEAAAELNVAKVTLQNWLKLGRIQAFKAESRGHNEPQLFTRDAVETFRAELGKFERTGGQGDSASRRFLHRS